MHGFIDGFFRFQTLAMGLLLPGISVMQFREMITFLENKVETVGMVVDHVSYFDRSYGEYYFQSVVAFRDKHQQLYHVVSATATDDPEEKGSLVKVYYDPAHPKRAAVDGFGYKVFVPFMALFFAVFCFVGLLVLHWEHYQPFLGPLLARIRPPRKTRRRKKTARKLRSGKAKAD
ncbi:DUF3592 domain-containing protein [Hahella sp. SMD15-11]|uniref:DUF3592 domain-containing protein n=1 Tax=Thermohahella caldifontis TaxID=3142973 RepID=A0AB39USP1_9GAMM